MKRTVHLKTRRTNQTKKVRTTQSVKLELTADVLCNNFIQSNDKLSCCSADVTLKPGTRTPPPPPVSGRAEILGHLSDTGATGGDGAAAQASGNFPRARANQKVYLEVAKAFAA